MAVYKDKKRGTWYTSFPYVDWTGKRCRKLKRGFLTKKEAQNWENHFKLQKANSLDMTFEDFYGIYETDVKPKIRYNTWCTKEHIIKTKILPYFKDLSMRDITPRDIIKWQNTMRESINNKGKEYTGTYLKTVQAQLSSIFNHAVRFYELPTNPVRVAGPMGQNESDEMKFWTKEEYMKFIPTMANKPYSYMAFELLYWCGIRLGELRALTPADFDFETNTLSFLWYPNRDENNYYIHCDAIKVVALPDKSELISDWNSHKIYWQKIEGTYNGEEIPVKWISEYKIMINEQVIDVRGIGYDYRWYSKKWK